MRIMMEGLIMIDANTTVQALLDLATAKLNEIPSGETFIVRDLFCGVDWKRIPMGTRIQLGSMFFNRVCDPAGGLSAAPLDKTPQHQQRYKKL